MESVATAAEGFTVALALNVLGYDGADCALFIRFGKNESMFLRTASLAVVAGVVWGCVTTGQVQARDAQQESSEVHAVGADGGVTNQETGRRGIQQESSENLTERAEGTEIFWPSERFSLTEDRTQGVKLGQVISERALTDDEAQVQEAQQAHPDAQVRDAQKKSSEAHAMCTAEQVYSGADSLNARVACLDAQEADQRLRELLGNTNAPQLNSNAGYDVTRWGMSPDEVRRAVPGLTAGRANGHRYLFKREVVFNYPAVVTYRFQAKGGRLSDVLVVFKADEPKQQYHEFMRLLGRGRGEPLVATNYNQYRYGMAGGTAQSRLLPIENALHLSVLEDQGTHILIASAYPFADVVLINYRSINEFPIMGNAVIVPAMLKGPATGAR